MYGFQNLCPDDNKGANDLRLISLISRTLNSQYILLDKKRQNEKTATFVTFWKMENGNRKTGKGSVIPCKGMQLIHGDMPRELINIHMFPKTSIK